MRKKTLNIVLDGFIVMLAITAVLLIILILKRGDVPVAAQDKTPEPTVATTASKDTDSGKDEEPTPEPTEAEPTPEPADEKVYVTANDSVNIRSGPGTDNPVVGSASPGDKFELVEKTDTGWTKVKYNGSDAYIFTDFLDF
ncbi:MAG: SH3 domain-containing protein [Lachnospiraceae bacterium]|nr:SH3 domain-containing protein [Lachnospiraceae bacterium]